MEIPHLFIAYIAEETRKVRVCSWNNKGDDIEVENNGSKSNDIVEVRTGQTNQPANLGSGITF